MDSWVGPGSKGQAICLYSKGFPILIKNPYLYAHAVVYMQEGLSPPNICFCELYIALLRYASYTFLTCNMESAIG